MDFSIEGEFECSIVFILSDFWSPVSFDFSCLDVVPVYPVYAVFLVELLLYLDPPLFLLIFILNISPSFISFSFGFSLSKYLLFSSECKLK